MRYELKSIAVWPFVKVAFFFNLIAGFLMGLLYALFIGFFMSVLSNIPALDTGDIPVGQLSIGFLMIFMPIVMSIGAATLNTLLGVILILIYNLVTRLTGGLEINLNPVKIETSPPVPMQPAGGYSAPLPPSPGLKPEPPIQPPGGTENDNQKPDNPENIQP